MEPGRLHVTGGSGSGTTTLGRALASAWSVPHADTDDYYWQPTAPPFTTPRAPAERLALMEALFLPRRAWVLSGSIGAWADPIVPRIEAVVLLRVDPAVRIERIDARERRRTGELGTEVHRAFVAWARRYDDPTFDGRSRHGHEAWARRLGCPVLNLDAAAPVDDLVASICAWDLSDDRAAAGAS